MISIQLSNLRMPFSYVQYLITVNAASTRTADEKKPTKNQIPMMIQARTIFRRFGAEPNRQPIKRIGKNEARTHGAQGKRKHLTERPNNAHLESAIFSLRSFFSVV